MLSMANQRALYNHYVGDKTTCSSNGACTNPADVMLEMFDRHMRAVGGGRAFGVQPADVGTGLSGPIVCPPGFELACNYAQTYYTTLQTSGVDVSTWDPNNLLATLGQWWNASKPPSAPPSPPLPQDVAQWLPLLQKAVEYWQTLGGPGAPGAPYTLPPGTWQFPWQVVPLNVADLATAVQKAFEEMMRNPTLRDLLSRGQIPPFDPTKIDWSVLANSTLGANWKEWSDALGQNIQKIQRFVTRGATCNLFADGNIARVSDAWAKYVADETYDVCLAVTPQPTPSPLPPLPPGPALPPTPSKAPPADTKASGSSSNTGLIVAGLVGAAAVAVLGYALVTAKKPGGAHLNPLPRSYWVIYSAPGGMVQGFPYRHRSDADRSAQKLRSDGFRTEVVTGSQAARRGFHLFR